MESFPMALRSRTPVKRQTWSAQNGKTGDGSPNLRLRAIAGKFHPFKAIFSIPDARRNKSTGRPPRNGSPRRRGAARRGRIFVAKIQRHKVSTMRLASTLVKTLNFMKRRGDSMEICKYAIKRKPGSPAAPSAVATTFAAVRAGGLTLRVNSCRRVASA